MNGKGNYPKKLDGSPLSLGECGGTMSSDIVELIDESFDLTGSDPRGRAVLIDVLTASGEKERWAGWSDNSANGGWRRADGETEISYADEAWDE